MTLPKIFAPDLALKFTWFNQNVLRQSQDSRTPRHWRDGLRAALSARSWSAVSSAALI
jgi:hypothetical protein